MLHDVARAPSRAARFLLCSQAEAPVEIQGLQEELAAAKAANNGLHNFLFKDHGCIVFFMWDSATLPRRPMLNLQRRLLHFDSNNSRKPRHGQLALQCLNPACNAVPSKVSGSKQLAKQLQEAQARAPSSRQSCAGQLASSRRPKLQLPKIFESLPVSSQGCDCKWRTSRHVQGLCWGPSVDVVMLCATQAQQKEAESQRQKLAEVKERAGRLLVQIPTCFMQSSFLQLGLGIW